MMQKLKTFFALLCMLTCSVCMQATVYEVSTAAEFKTHWKNNDSIRLVADIDLSSFTEDDRVEEYTAELSGVHADSTKFYYTISNVTQMMAYKMTGAKIHEILFKDCTPDWITNLGGEGTALLCRTSTNCQFYLITLVNININGTPTIVGMTFNPVYGDNASTFVCNDKGSTFNSLIAYQCRAYCRDAYAGIFAATAEGSTFKSCDARYGCAVHADGSFNLEGNAGGIAGTAKNCTFYDCINQATVSSSQDRVGGITGDGEGTTYTQCFNYGSVKHTTEMEYDDFSSISDATDAAVPTELQSDELEKLAAAYGVSSDVFINMYHCLSSSYLTYVNCRMEMNAWAQHNNSLLRYNQEVANWEAECTRLKNYLSDPEQTLNIDAYNRYQKLLTEEPKLTEETTAFKASTFNYCMLAAAVIVTVYQISKAIYESNDDDEVGGITGYLTNGTVNQCANYGMVYSADAYSGGIVGLSEGSSTISDCLNGGTVKGYEQTGGIVGSMSGGTLTNNLNFGNISKGNSTYDTFGHIYGDVLSTDITNNYYSSDSKFNSQYSYEGCSPIAQSELVSGSLTVTLNEASKTKGWRQTIGTDHFPTLFTASDSLTSDSIQNNIDTTIRTKNASNLITGLCNQFSDIVLTGDVSLNTSVFNLSSSFMPFRGSIDGQGHTISDVTYYLPDYTDNLGSNDNSNTWVALLPYAKNATFKNLTLKNFYISNVTSSGSYLSLLVANATNCTFDSIHIANSGVGDDGSENCGVEHIAAIVAQTHNCTLTDCSVDANSYVRGITYKLYETTKTGGLVSEAYDTKFLRCYNEAEIYADDDYAGGIASYAEGSTLESCANTGSVEGEEYVGGIVGYAKNTTLLHCANTGPISCNSYFLWFDIDEDEVGGLVGTLSGSSSSVTYCANWGNVDDGDGDYLVGTFDDNAPAVSSSVNYYYCSLGGKTKSNISSRDAVLSGKTFYDINVAQNSITWYQDIDLSESSLSGADSTLSTNYPVPIPCAGRVYSNVLCDGTQSYSNIYKSTAAHTSKEDGYGLCTVCGKVITESVGDTITVSTPRQLIAVANAVNRGVDYSNTTVILTNDIDMSGFGYTPMGIEYDKPYKGVFDGQGHRIKNMNLSYDQGGIGFFAHVAGESTVIKNLIIDSSCSVESSAGGGVAGLIGCVQSDNGTTCNVTVYNCGNEANITGDQNVAGIIGGVYVNDNTHIYVYNTYNSGTIAGNYESASMCGYARRNYSFVNCYNCGTVSGVSSSTNYFYRNASSGTHLCENCYDIYSGQTNVISTDDVTYGALCQKLNANCGEYSPWTQNLPSDSHPTFGENGLQYTRQSSYQWGTIVLPFDVSVGDKDPYSFYKLTGVQDSTITVTRVTSTLSAGTPAIVYVDGSAKNTTTNKYALVLTPSGSVSTTINNPDAVGGLTLTGTYTATDITNESGYYISTGTFCSMDSILNTGRDSVVCCDPYTAYLGGTLTGTPKALSIVSDIINISTPEDLNALATSVNSGTDYSNAIVTLTNDIDMKGVSFTPIGRTKYNAFKGTFNGNGYRIKNLVVNADTTGVGLFGCVAGSNTIIKNVIIDSSCSFTNAGTATAGLIGCLNSKAYTSKTCHVSILNCGNEATVTGGINTAGILGGIYENDYSVVTIQNCYNSGDINGTTESATLCGYARIRFNISNCYNTGSLTGGETGKLLYRYYSYSRIYDEYQHVSNCYDVNGAEGDGVVKLDTMDVALGIFCDTLNAHRGDLDAWSQDLGSFSLEEGGTRGFSHPTFGDVGVRYTRSMTKQWGTIVLPFDVEVGDTTSYSLYKPSYVYGKTLSLTKVTGTLPAGTPAIICMKEDAKSEETDTYELSLSVKDNISKTICTPDTIGGLALTGVYLPTDITSKKGYKIYDGSFVNIDSLKTVPAALTGSATLCCEPFQPYLAGTLLSNPMQLSFTTESDTVTITDAAGLNDLAYYVNQGIPYTDKVVVLGNDIDMSGVTYTPVGTSEYPFAGTFDGNGYRIKNLVVDMDTTGVGLFGCATGTSTVIKNVIIDKSCTITNHGSATGGIIGCLDSESGTTTCNVSILNCGNEATINGYYNAAGILGAVYNNDKANLVIQNCYNSGTINGTSECASLCAYARKHFKIANCYNIGALTGGEKGRLLFRYNSDYGSSWSQVVYNCFDINGEGNYATNLETTDVTLGILCDRLNADLEDLSAWTQDLGDPSSEEGTGLSHPTFGDAGVRYTRSMTNQWSTIVLPFDVTINDSEPYDFYQISDVSGSALTLTEMSGTLAAGTPAIIRMSEAAKSEGTGKYYLALTADGATSTTINNPDAVGGLTLTGAYTSTDITDKDGYIIANNAFWNIAAIKGENKVYCSPFHAWLAGTISSGAKQLTINFGDDTPTAVEIINALTSPQGGLEAIYDLNGRPVNNLQKGVNIVILNNGKTKKVLVK